MFRNMPLGTLNENTGLREKLRLASVGEFEGIDIDIEEVAALSEKYSAAYVTGMMDSFNLKAGAWLLPFTIDADEEVFSEGIKKLERYARIAKAVDAPRVLAAVSSPDKTKAAVCKERLASIAKLLGKHGCAVGLDCPGGCSWELKETGIVLNARRWYLSGGSLQELKKVEWDRVMYVTLGDVGADRNGRFLPGETGIVDLPGFLNVLAGAGYDGPVAPELPDRNLLTLPEEMATRLLGGSLLRVWNKAFSKT